MHNGNTRKRKKKQKKYLKQINVRHQTTDLGSSENTKQDTYIKKFYTQAYYILTTENKI